MQVGGLENKSSIDLGLMQVWSRLDGSPRLMDSPWWFVYNLYIWVCPFEFFVHFLLVTCCRFFISYFLCLLGLCLWFGGLATLYASFCDFHFVMTLASSGCVLCPVPSCLCSFCFLVLVASSSISFISSSYMGSCYWVPLDFYRNIFCLDMF